METIFKRLFSIMLCLTFVYALASCSGGIDTDEAKVFINEFLVEVSSGDYSGAEEFLHPDRPADLEKILTDIESKEEIDFKSGIKIEKFTGFSASFYDSTVGGSALKLSFNAKVGDATVKFTVEIVKNESGYGVYNLDIDT